VIKLDKVFPAVLSLLLAGCFGATAARPGRPFAGSALARHLVGCWDVGNQRFALDTVRVDTAAIWRARFAPRAPIVAGSWYVTRDEEVWVFRNDGLWGTSYQMRLVGDSLVGKRRTGGDVPGRGSPPDGAVATRTTANCPAESAGP
jgi:hypothetical protein